MYFEGISNAYPKPDDSTEVNNYLLNDYEVELENLNIRMFNSD